jgi:D-arabinose 1-dehydrogenase-like Zn-dependent alcohol dehydrogenase
LGTGHLSISSGHEIVGKVTAVGSAVSKFKVGEIAGVGCFVDSELVRVKQVMNNFVMKE